MKQKHPLYYMFYLEAEECFLKLKSNEYYVTYMPFYGNPSDIMWDDLTFRAKISWVYFNELNNRCLNSCKTVPKDYNHLNSLLTIKEIPKLTLILL